MAGDKIACPPWRHWAGWIAAAVVSLVAAFFLVQGRRSADLSTQQPAVRLDFDLGPDVSLGSATGAAVILSPDGTRLVFASEGADGVRRLFARRLDQAKATPLAKTEGAFEPFFSPDGQWVGFLAQGKLKKMRVDGGEPVSLCDASNGRGASWGEDDTIVAALDTQAGLSQVSAEGGKPVPLTNLVSGETTHRWPQILPGAKAVLFNSSVAYANYDESEIAVVSLKDHRRKTVLQHGMYPRYLPSGHLVYVTKGRLFAVPFDLDRLETRGTATPLEEVSSNLNLGSAQIDFSRAGTLVYRSGGTEGLRTMEWLDEAGKTSSLGLEPAIYIFPRLAPDGKRLAYLVSEGANTDLWVSELQRGSKTRLTGGGNNAYPVWSPDGQFVVFQSTEGLFWTRADGAGKSQPLLQSKKTLFPYAFSPDGKQLVFSQLIPGEGGEIRTVPVENASGRLKAGEPRLFLKTATAGTPAVFSPDGRWLAYADAEGSSYEIYVRAFPDNGTQVQVSNVGGIVPVWSQNGRELFYRTEDQRIMVVNYAFKEGKFQAEKPRVWSGKQLANIGLGVNLDLHPDGKRFVALMPAEGPKPQERQSRVTLVVNFFDEARRRVAVQGK